MFLCIVLLIGVAQGLPHMRLILSTSRTRSTCNRNAIRITSFDNFSGLRFSSKISLSLHLSLNSATAIVYLQEKTTSVKSRNRHHRGRINGYFAASNILGSSLRIAMAIRAPHRKPIEKYVRLVMSSRSLIASPRHLAVEAQSFASKSSNSCSI